MVSRLEGTTTIELGIRDRQIAPEEIATFRDVVARTASALAKRNGCDVIGLWQGTSPSMPFSPGGPFPSDVFVRFVRAEGLNRRG